MSFKRRILAMIFRIRTAVCTIFLLLLSCAALFAASNLLSLKVRSTDDRIQAFRCQQGPEAESLWKELEGAAPTMSLEAFDYVQDKLFIQQSEDSVSWSETYAYHYDAATDVWRLASHKTSELQRSITAYAVAMRTASPIVHLYETSYGAGVEFMQETPFLQNAVFIADFSASGADSNNVFMDQFLILNGRFGLGYKIAVTKRLNLVPSFTYGVLAHTGNTDLDHDGNVERQWYFDQQVRGSLGFDFMLNNGMSMVVKPEVAAFFESNNVGFLYGITAGLKFGW